MKNQSTIITITLAVLLILALGYIGLVKYSDYKQKNNLEVYQQGARYGYEQAIVQIVQQATTCQQVPLRVENQTINMIAVNCLQQKG